LQQAVALQERAGSLEAWVTHAQSLKPSAQMPNITAFDGDELRAIVEYWRELK
jgi:cytochrome c1